jgi:glycosyltransferase involved in cell wall biosynthesis
MSTVGSNSVVTGTNKPTPPGPVPVATTPRLSVAVPAHDEASVIGRCLDALLGGLAAVGLGHEDIELAVVCNGCSDDTAAIARRHLGAEGLRHHRVLELPTASKPAALRLADSVLRAFPRLYVDADVELSTRAALDVAAALERSGVLAARPNVATDVNGARALARRYARARARLDLSRDHVWGAGVYGVSVDGHRRLGSHPDVTADDLWVDSLFTAHEIAVVNTDPVVVRTPRDLTGVLAVARRSQRGRRELGAATPATASSTARALARSMRYGPVDAVVYGAVATWAHVATRPGATQDTPVVWERDRSSR